MVKYLQVVISSIFFGMGLATASYSLWSCVLAYQTKSWPSVRGLIIRDDCLIVGDRTSDRYTQYQYTVNSFTYFNSLESFGLPIASNQCVADLRKSENVTVYYDATNPGNAVLKPSEYRNGIFGFIVGLLFMAISSYCCFFALRKPTMSCIGSRRLYNNKKLANVS